MIRANRLCAALIGAGVAAFSTVAWAQSKDRVLFSTVDLSNNRLEFAVSGAKFCGTKAWNPEKDVPPLPIAAAVRAAVNAEKPKKRWVVNSVSLQSGGCIRDVRWYYSIALYDEEDLLSSEPPDFVERVVLMDGSVVLPRLAKQ